MRSDVGHSCMLHAACWMLHFLYAFGGVYVMYSSIVDVSHSVDIQDLNYTVNS